MENTWLQSITVTLPSFVCEDAGVRPGRNGGRGPGARLTEGPPRPLKGPREEREERAWPGKGLAGWLAVFRPKNREEGDVFHIVAAHLGQMTRKHKSPPLSLMGLIEPNKEQTEEQQHISIPAEGSV